MSLLTEKTNLAGSEGARRATVDPASREAVVGLDPEVSEQAKRRRFLVRKRDLGDSRDSA